MKIKLLVSATLIALSSSHTVSSAQTTQYSYNSLGLIESIDGPRSDINDISSYEYNALGQRSASINALGHRTEYSYDSNGRVQQWTDPNGLVTLLSYDNDGHLSQYSVTGRITQYTYDAVGNLVGVVSPNGSWLYLQYDDARRLVRLEDTQDNSITYTRDLAGNQTSQQILDAQGQLVQSQQQVFDAMSRVIEIVSGTGNSNTYQYDKNSNLTSNNNAKNQTTTLAYDALDRLVTDTNPLSHNTQYRYDSDDNLIEVIDPEGLVTRYAYDSFGNRLSQDSPDTGLTTFAYDSANNLIKKTDAKGIFVNYSYDALNRLIQITYPNSEDDISYTYDQDDFAIGKISGIQDKSGSTQYSYNAQGELISETHTISGISYTTQYAYNNTGHVSSITYPSGKILQYQRNVAGQINQIVLDDNGQTTKVMNNALHLPFGGLTQFSYGNGKTLTKGFDLDYRLTQLSITQDNGQTLEAIQEINYTFDPLGNITQIDDIQTPAQNYSFDYDAISRLTLAQGAFSEFLYSYDMDSNRTQLGINGDTQDYSYTPDTNHLAQINGNTTENFSYDANGNLIATDTRQYHYGDNNRLIQVQEGSLVLADYLYNAHGQRVSKTTNNESTHYLYGISGNLIAEHNENGEALSEYIYLNGKRLAMVTSASGPSNAVEMILDNQDSSSTAFAGDWTVSTSVNGYQGDNYQYHTANGASPDGTVIDNSDAAFSTSGDWTTSTSVTGFNGPNY